MIPWLVIKFCNSSAAGRATKRTSAIAMSCGQLSCSSEPGAWAETKVTTRPMKTGIVVSRIATIKPVTKRAATRCRACRA